MQQKMWLKKERGGDVPGQLKRFPPNMQPSGVGNIAALIKLNKIQNENK